jgi:hypothetical protein
MKTCIKLLALTLALPVFSQTDGDNIVIGKYRNLHSTITNAGLTMLVWLPGNENAKKMLENLK